MFSPAFGAFLHACNARALGRKDEAKANTIWFYVALGFLGAALLSIFIPGNRAVVFQGGGIGILFGWYLTLGKVQVENVKHALHDQYPRKSWTKPLLIATGCLTGYFTVAIIFSIVAMLCITPTPRVGFKNVFSEIAIPAPQYQTIRDFSRPADAVKGDVFETQFTQSDAQFHRLLTTWGLSAEKVLSAPGAETKAASKLKGDYPWYLTIKAVPADPAGTSYTVRVEGHQGYD